MAPRINFMATQGSTTTPQQQVIRRRSNNTTLPTCPICHQKHPQKPMRPGISTLTPQKMNLTLKERILEAVKEGDLTEAKQLLQRNRRNLLLSDTYLLHVAAENNQPLVASFLLQYISPNIVNAKGNTPAHLAAKMGHVEVVKVLLCDPHFDANKIDTSGFTYKQWLCVPLFEAVLFGNKAKIQLLLSIGASLDMEAGGVMGSTLVKELQVKTARQLAIAMNRESLVTSDDEPKASNDTSKIDPDLDDTSGSRNIPLDDLPISSLRLQMGSSEAIQTKTNQTTCPGYVCILTYDTFKDRPDLHLEAGQTDAHNLGGVFRRMGYSGHTSYNLTREQTEQELIRVRNMEALREAGCLVFIITSRPATSSRFFSSDLRLLSKQWVLDHFKDSQCPQLKDKPKLFIWNLHYDYYASDRNASYRLDKRLDEPLRNVVCLHSKNEGPFLYPYSRHGTPFSQALCCTLARHAHHMELKDLYKAFIAEYSKLSPGKLVPKLANIGFSKQFFFNPRS